MQTDREKLRAEMRTDIANLRTEIKSEVNLLRLEFQEGLSKMQTFFENLIFIKHNSQVPISNELFESKPNPTQQVPADQKIEENQETALSN